MVQAQLSGRDPGKILPDTKTVEACEIKEKDFLVLMVSKVCTVLIVKHA